MFITGFVWIESRSFVLSQKLKKYSCVKIQPHVITYGRLLDLLNKENLCIKLHHKSQQLYRDKNHPVWM